MSQGLVTVETDPVAFWQVLPCSPKTNGWPKSHIDWENNDLFMGPCVTLSTWGPSKSNPTKWSSCLAQWDTHKLVLKRWYTTNEQTLFPKKKPFKQGIYVTHFPALGDLVKSRTHFVFFADLFAFAFAFALPRGLSIFSPGFLESSLFSARVLHWRMEKKTIRYIMKTYVPNNPLGISWILGTK